MVGWSVGRRGVLVGMVCWLVGVHNTPARQPTNRTYQQTTQPTHTPSSQSAIPKQPRQSHHPAKPHTHTNQPQTRANTIRAPCPKSMSGNGPRSGATWACRGVPPAPSQRNATQTTTATQTVCSKTVELQKRARHPRFSGSVSVPQKCNKNASSACVTRVFGDCD